MTAISGGGGDRVHRQTFQRLRAPPGDDDLLQIPGTGDIGGRQRLAGGGKKLFPGKGGLEEYDVNPQQVGGGAAGVRIFFKAVVQAVLLFGSETWVVTPRMGKALGGGSGPGDETVDGTAPVEDTGQGVDIHLGGDGKEGGGVLDDGRIVHRQTFQRLRAPPGDDDLLQIPGTGDIGGRQRLAGGGKKLFPGKGGLEEYDVNPQQVGGGAAGVRIFFKAVVQAVLLFGSETWVVTPRMGKALGGGSGPGDETVDGTAPVEDTGQGVDIHLGGDGKGGGGVLDDGGIYLAAPEHGRTVHHYVITVRPV